ncbi:DUF2852 domain-containing protein [Falsirhodobacter sp. 20TX0035]|uniref:DUF2852 domain-containing protein n=1 Tax=Falsirhodobacter sp. 20TX0035 TaxID=3022019 RepID=UPI00232F4157|nr:DUF2852 domain-containing protein [Falsirhodobacter sp. 20TX0035]MDB6453322.1 DUF2852 domain-containing protein [Falsirhodobacter sp. 20TX0035]
MNLSSTVAPGGLLTWPRRAEEWLDARGRAAWIAATILGFILVWPVGLALLAYMIWRKRMFTRNGSCGRRAANIFNAAKPSGNAAFDAYKQDTLKRLEDEQMAFEGFLKRLREAKDKQEFDAFMSERARTRDITPAETN